MNSGRGLVAVVVVVVCVWLGALAAGTGISENWLSRVTEEIQRSEYCFSLLDDGSWSAPNRAHGLRSRVSPAGLVVTSRTKGEEAWRLDLRLAGIGREGAVEPSADPTLQADASRVELLRDVATEWYVNGERGLEQGFTIPSAPAGDRTVPLLVEMDLGGTLSAFPAEDGRSILFKDPRGVPVIRYGELKVEDAHGESVSSRLAVSVGRLEIAIDDSDAIYPLTVDPLMTSPVWTAESNQDSAEFGWSVNAAGDVNGDGYSDVVVGAYLYDNGQTDEGRAFVYAGSASGLSASPAWTAEGNQASAGFGRSVATAGDVNGDGYSDVVVGAYLYDNGQTDEGRAFVYLGSASGLSLSPAWTAESDQAAARYGFAVAGVGDVNGDGYSDVIVGADFYENGQTVEGRAFVYLGSASGLASSPSWTAEGNQANAYFGASLAAAGDVNGDGYSDVVVSADGYDNGQTDEGRAYVYHGSGSGLSSSPAWTVESDQGWTYFGFSVATAGDVNGDGYSDVIVGAPQFSNGQMREGRAYVYLGSVSGLSSSPAWTAESDQADADLGVSAATAGDVNGDGYSDVIVGGERHTNGQTEEGRAYVYLGSASGLAPSPAWTAESDQQSGHFGRWVATAGDINGDGYSDVIVGANGYDNGQTDEGRAYVYHGSASGLSGSPAWTAESNQASAQFGYSVASAGDVNGDGYSDVLVGAPNYDNGQAYQGRAYLFAGSSSGPSPTPSWMAEGDQGSAYFGRSLASAGDVNGDGYSDVIIGAHMYDNGEMNEGRAYVYHGSGSGLSSSPAWFAESNKADAEFGSSVASAGDVNGDGYSDVIVGAPPYTVDQSEEGKAYVYFGSPSGLGASPAWSVESHQENAHFGSSVSGAGDVNGDGYSDVAVGANHYSNGQSSEGRVFVYQGSSFGLGTLPAWTGEGEQSSADFGCSVASAGDVNGDGYSDLIVGADLYYSGAGRFGRAYVYSGSAAGLLAAPSWSAVPQGTGGTYFGISVASAGDVNGDGYSDVIVGAEQEANGQSLEGRAYLFQGSASGLASSAGWTAEIDQSGAQFGNSVASAGDVNGDGYSDVIIGAKYHDNGQTDEGRAYVYYGNASGGLTRVLFQARADGTAPIPLWGRSDSADALRLIGYGSTAAGRGKVRLEWEVKPQGSAFNGGGLGRGTWWDTGTPVARGSGGALNELLSGLQPATSYKWRLRVASNSPLFPRTPWFSIQGNNVTEAKLKTRGYDSDGDLRPDSTDNCPGSFNPDQGDGDGDGTGDVCDTPKVMEIVPVIHSTGVPVWANVTATFSEPMDGTTITLSTFRVLVSGSPIAGTVSVSADGRVAWFDPTGPLTTSTPHDVQITSGVRDLQGSSLGATTTDFTTEASSAPNVVSVSSVPSQDVSTGMGTGEHRGAALSPAGDVDGDGYADWLVGAPDYDEGGLTDRGRALLFLGSASGPHQAADVRFLGHSAGDRLGISLAGGQDFDGLGTDFLIGAEQHDGTTAYGPGKAYLVSFNPAWLGTTQDIDAAAKMVFAGNASEDRAGHSVAMSADMNGDGLGEALIGAPAAHHGTTTDCGEAYLVYGIRGQAGTVSLSQIGQTAGPDGVTYFGHSASDRLGWSVSAGEDFNGDGRPDVLLGAPYANVGSLANAGSAYLDIGPLQRGVIDASVIGVDLGSHDGIVVEGDQALQHTGWSVALVPDTDGDPFAEVLIGAPNSTVGADANAGEVFVLVGQASTPATPSAIGVSVLRGPGGVLGFTYQGANAGDQLGYSVGSAGDANEDGLGDVLMGAPGYDVPGFAELPDAGATYLGYGPCMAKREGGIIDVDGIGATVPGVVFVGASAGDSLGIAVAGVGDANGDGRDDIALGAPNYDASTMTDAGASYLITAEPEPVPSGPPPCDSSGCTVTDESTGARLVVPAGALSQPVSISVAGILSTGQLPVPEPAGKMLAGAAEFHPEWQYFGVPNPTAYVPTRSSIESQLTNGESLDLYFFDGASWVDSWRDGTVVTNPVLPDRRAVSGQVGVLHGYAAFLSDQDGDGMRDTRDCAPADPGAFAVPPEVSSVRILPDKATMEWDSLAAVSGSGTTYDMLRGKLREWPVGSGVSETCLRSGSTDPRASDPASPAAGTGVYYLVRGRNGCGIGTYGAGRTSTACP